MSSVQRAELEPLSKYGVTSLLSRLSKARTKDPDNPTVTINFFRPIAKSDVPPQPNEQDVKRATELLRQALASKPYSVERVTLANGKIIPRSGNASCVAVRTVVACRYLKQAK